VYCFCAPHKDLAKEKHEKPGVRAGKSVTAPMKISKQKKARAPEGAAGKFREETPVTRQEEEQLFFLS